MGLLDGTTEAKGGKGKGKGQIKIAVCMRQGSVEGENVRYKHQILPEHTALKMIAAGKAMPCPADGSCESLNDAIVIEE